MPATLPSDPLGIGCVFSDGSTRSSSLDGLPCPSWPRTCWPGLAELIHPHGTMDAAGTVTHYVQAFRDMTRRLAGAGVHRRGGGSAPPAGWPSTGWPPRGRRRRAPAGCWPRFARAGGALDAAVAELAAGRAFNPQPYHRPLPPYREDEWERLTPACRRIADESFAAHKRAWPPPPAAAPARRRLEPGNLRWLLARTGPVGASSAFGQHLGCSDNVVRQRGGVLEASRDLFPHLDVVIAYRLLFGIYSGIVPDGIDDLVTGDIDWAGDSTILLSYVKGRTAAESLNLPRRAVRLLEQWLAHSALLRSHAGPSSAGSCGCG